MAEPAPDKRSLILAAAETRFSRYGFRRTSMEDIAQEAGISRASLYLEFRNKEEIFSGVVKALCDAAIAAAEAALRGPGPLAARLEAALIGKNARIVELVHGSPHGAELMDANSRLGGGHAAEVEARFRELLTRALRQASRAGELDLERAGISARAFAELFSRAAAGLKTPDVSAAAYRASVARFVHVMLIGLTSSR